jgi:hypothetical protein
MSQCIEKWKIYSKNDWNLIFMKFLVSIKHCDSIRLGYVCEPCEEFDNYHITMGVFGGNDHKYVVN